MIPANVGDNCAFAPLADELVHSGVRGLVASRILLDRHLAGTKHVNPPGPFGGGLSRCFLEGGDLLTATVDDLEPAGLEGSSGHVRRYRRVEFGKARREDAPGGTGGILVVGG